MKSARIALLLVLSSAYVLSQGFDPSADKGYSTIQAADLSRHLYVIASDEYEGRETSMKGQKMAAEYISNYFRTLGLRPVGDNGTYYQHFDVEVSRLDRENSFVRVGSSTFSFGDAYLTTSLIDTTFSAGAVFLGFADSQIDPSHAEKIAGRIVLTLPGSREQVSDTTERGQMMRLFTMRRDSGVLATVMLMDPEGPLSYDAIIERYGTEGRTTMRRVDTEPSQRRRRRDAIRLYASRELTNSLIAMAGMSYEHLWQTALKDSAFEPVFIDDARITIANTVAKETRPTENVLGFLEGSDPNLKEEVLVLTAHYDHDGMTSDGTVYNGADDDGSGTVAILELAEAFTANPVKPKRSILFMTVTGEEKGLLGSAYYTDHPVFPLENTIANVNIDMIGRIGTEYMEDNDSMYVYVIGSDKISKDLDVLLQEANRQTVNLHLDYTYNDDNDPNRFYYRSDHYNFAKNGVPVVFFFTGTHPDYHRPTDTPDKILYERMAIITRLIYATSWKVAQDPDGLAKNPPSSQ